MNKKIFAEKFNLSNYYEFTKNFYELTQKGDLILNMGAGDCHNFWSILNRENNSLNV